MPHPSTPHDPLQNPNSFFMSRQERNGGINQIPISKSQAELHSHVVMQSKIRQLKNIADAYDYLSKVRKISGLPICKM